MTGYKDLKNIIQSSQKMPALLTKGHAKGLSTDVIKLYFEMHETLLVKNVLAHKPHRILSLMILMAYAAKCFKNCYQFYGI